MVYFPGSLSDTTPELALVPNVVTWQRHTVQRSQQDQTVCWGTLPPTGQASTCLYCRLVLDLRSCGSIVDESLIQIMKLLPGTPQIMFCYYYATF